MSSTAVRSNDLVRLFIEQQSALRALLMQRLGDEEEVLEILQDLFLRLVSQNACVAEIREPCSYIRRMAINLAIDRMRERRRRTAIIGSCDLAEALTESETGDNVTPERVAQARQRLRQMQEVLDRLPEDCRQAFLLSRCDGLTYDEIGERLGVSRNMVKKHLVRALGELRSAMPLLK